MQFWEPGGKYLPLVWTFLINFRTDLEKRFIFKKSLSRKWSSGDIEGTVYNPAEKLQPIVRKVLAKSLKTNTKKQFLEKHWFNSNVTLDALDKVSEVWTTWFCFFSAKILWNFARKFENEKKYFNPAENICFQNHPQDT